LNFLSKLKLKERFLEIVGSYGSKTELIMVRGCGSGRRRRRDHDIIRRLCKAQQHKPKKPAACKLYGPGNPINQNYYGTYTLSPPNVLPFSSKSLFNLTATLRTLSRHSSIPLQFPATVQHSEHAFDAAFTVSSSSSSRVCRTVRISTKWLSPALQETIPLVGFIVVSETR
jgi:hypothetical protein